MPSLTIPQRGRVPVALNLYTAQNWLMTEINSTAAATASAVYSLANLAIYIPFTLESDATVTKLWWNNGTVVSGNVDAGIYDENGNAMVTKGSTAQSGTSVPQVVDVTDTLLPRGYYYFAIACDNTTATFSRYSPTTNFQQMMGVLEQTSAFALPTPTATFAKAARSYLPNVGMQLYRTVGP